MTLLFDENLSPKLVIALADQFPGSCHVDRVGLGSADDNSVWKYAQQNNLTLVSKDSDFQEKSLLYGYPPKVIWIRRGNCTNRQIEMLLRTRAEQIYDFIGDNASGFLMLL